MIGVLGGMGPLATADFFNKVIAATSAADDGGHVPLLIQSDPRIPPRPPAILSGGPSPLPALLAGRDRLIAAGALALVMPCNTAHFWYDDLARDCPVPFISIVDAVIAQIGAVAKPGATIGIIATRATLDAHIFDTRLIQMGYAPLVPDQKQMESQVLPAIGMVKAGQALAAGPPLETVVRSLLAKGASVVVLACTETPIALAAMNSPVLKECLDPNDALARQCVAWWQSHEAAHPAAHPA